MLKKVLRTLDRSIALPVENWFRRQHRCAPWIRKAPLHETVSFIVPCHNVGRYLDDFFRSIVTQSTGLHNLEVVLVDDGSTDDTAAVCKRWQSDYPRLIRYHYQENAGSADARNTGMGLASGKWLSFPDPDDYLHWHYLHHFNRMIRKGRAHRLSMVVCNLLVANDATGRVGDTHALRYRFAKTENWFRVPDLGEHVQLSLAHAFYLRTVILANDLKLNVDIRPRFEDANFVNRYLSRVSGSVVVFCKAAKYYYRKRGDQSSQMDTAHSKKEFYLNQPELGWLGVLSDAKDTLGYVPRFIQRTILYDTTGHLRISAQKTELLNILSVDERQRLKEALHKSFGYIDADTIKNFSLSSFHEEIRVGALGLFKGREPDRTVVYVKDFDPASQRVKLLYFSRLHHDDLLHEDGSPLTRHYPKTIGVSLLTEPFFYEHSFWTELSADGLSLARPNIPVAINLSGKRTLGSVSASAVRSAFNPPVPISIPPRDRKLRERALREPVAAQFAGGWVFMDRPDKAGDNGEAMYRFMAEHYPTVPISFVLDKASPDWPRLKRDGFNLVAFLSDQHFSALVHAKFLLGSHGDRFITRPFPRAGVQDLLSYQFVFLQHGVFVHDQSHWLNDMMPRVLITSTPQEYDSVVGDGSGYRLTKRETCLTGLARHDVLLEQSQSAKKDLLFVMPTWREALTRKEGATNTRYPIGGFSESEYVQQWREFLSDERLRHAADAAGLTIAFAPHPNFSTAIDQFDLPSWVHPVNALTEPSLQPYFARSRVAVTDYSSVGFDFGFLDVPLVYFQFDRGTFYGGHIYRPGYFEFERDGFGPVATNCNQAVEATISTVLGGEAPLYAQRRRDTFPFRDGGCRQRIYDVVTKL